MGILHVSSNCVRATFNNGLSPSDVDWCDLKGEPTKHGPSLMEVDCERKYLTTHQVDACSLEFTGEATPESTFGKGTPTITIAEVDPCSLELTKEAYSSSTTHQVDACSLKLTGEANSEPALWLTGELMKLTQMDTA